MNNLIYLIFIFIYYNYQWLVLRVKKELHLKSLNADKKEYGLIPTKSNKLDKPTAEFLSENLLKMVLL